MLKIETKTDRFKEVVTTQSVRPATVITTRTIRVYRQTKLKFFICMVRAPHDDIINSEHFL